MRTARLFVILLVTSIVAPGVASLHSLPPPADDAPLFPAGAMYREFSREVAQCRADAVCQANVLAAGADKVATDIAGLPVGAAGIAANVRYILASTGDDVEGLPAPESRDLPSAILGLYATLGSDVDEALSASVQAQSAALGAGEKERLRALVDGLHASLIATRSILPEEVAKALRQDLRTTLMLTSLVGSAPAGAARADWQALWHERAALLASVDTGAVARAGMLASQAVSDYLSTEVELEAGAGCEPELDLPFILIAGSCNDSYAADALYVLHIDRGGDDVYLNGAGAGIFAGAGVGVHIDEGEGLDVYNASGNAQGFGLAGVGIAINEGGHDLYSVHSFGQGFGVAGFGMLYDMGGDDTYLSPSLGDENPIGTKAGSLAGFGIIVDEGGTDYYRQDVLDGFVYGAAGGAGWMLERGDGADTYRSDEAPVYLLGEYLGEFAGPVQVSGEVSGTTVLYEEGGDDTYICGAHVRQGCQAAAGALSLTLLLEQGGNDVYTMGESISIELVPGVVVFPMGQGAAYGPSAPGGIGVLRDVGGNDSYTAEKWAQGFGTAGIAGFLDEAGADSYSLGAGTVGTRGDGETWVDGAAIGVDR